MNQIYSIENYRSQRRPTKPAEPESAQSLASADLETVLAAWQSATERLRQTHETLRDEVRRLTDELEAKNRELARKNRLEDLGRMAAHVAHEVRNSLVPLKLHTSLLARRAAALPACGELIEKLEVGFGTLETVVTDLLQFTADRQPQWGRFGLRWLVDDVCLSLAPQLAAQQIVVEHETPRELTAWGDAEMIRRAVLNLMLNALDAMPNGGALCITGIERAGGIEIEIADSGPGFALHTAARIFEPFYTTKPAGTGLGLAIVQRLMEVHRGQVLAANCAEGGAALTLRWPHHRDATREAA